MGKHVCYKRIINNNKKPRAPVILHILKSETVFFSWRRLNTHQIPYQLAFVPPRIFWDWKLFPGVSMKNHFTEQSRKGIGIHNKNEECQQFHKCMVKSVKVWVFSLSNIIHSHHSMELVFPTDCTVYFYCISVTVKYSWGKRWLHSINLKIILKLVKQSVQCPLLFKKQNKKPPFECIRAIMSKERNKMQETFQSSHWP